MKNGYVTRCLLLCCIAIKNVVIVSMLIMASFSQMFSAGNAIVVCRHIFSTELTAIKASAVSSWMRARRRNAVCWSLAKIIRTWSRTYPDIIHRSLAKCSSMMTKTRVKRQKNEREKWEVCTISYCALKIYWTRNTFYWTRYLSHCCVLFRIKTLFL